MRPPSIKGLGAMGLAPKALSAKGMARAGALLALAAAVLAGLAAIPHRQNSPVPLEVSPATGALARCRALGEAAEQNVQCQATWRALRDHFFTQTKDRRP